jgi:hypothetical protein
MVSKAAQLHDFKLGLVDAKLVDSEREGENRDKTRKKVKRKLGKE